MADSFLHDNDDDDDDLFKVGDHMWSVEKRNRQMLSRDRPSAERYDAPATSRRFLATSFATLQCIDDGRVVFAR